MVPAGTYYAQKGPSCGGYHWPNQEGTFTRLLVSPPQCRRPPTRSCFHTITSTPPALAKRASPDPAFNKSSTLLKNALNTTQLTTPTASTTAHLRASHRRVHLTIYTLPRRATTTLHNNCHIYTFQHPTKITHTTDDNPSTVKIFEYNS